MRNVTLCFLVRNNEILLAMKKEGFGAGKWNGIGGKVKESETIEEAAVRELEEEIGVRAKVSALEKVGKLDFHFNEHADWNQQMHIFLVREWEGAPTDSDEMVTPTWYKHDEIPYSKMWEDDSHWLPQVLDGKKIEGKFYFKGDEGEIERAEVKELVSQ